MGLPYAVEPGSLMQPSEAFLKANPTRTLPVLVDGDTIITESVAILQYLGTKYGPTPLTPAPEDPNYAAYLQFLVLGEASLAAGLTPLVRAMFMAPEDQKQNWTLKNNAESFIKQLQLVDAQLAKGPWLAGQDFTAADISVGYALAFGEFLGLHDGYSPAVADYHQRLKERPAFQKAQTVQ
jgi:glutathione S-transferase